MPLEVTVQLSHQPDVKTEARGEEGWDANLCGPCCFVRSHDSQESPILAPFPKGEPPIAKLTVSSRCSCEWDPRCCAGQID